MACEGATRPIFFSALIFYVSFVSRQKKQGVRLKYNRHNTASIQFIIQNLNRRSKFGQSVNRQSK
jgi:hypothetical protein